MVPTLSQGNMPSVAMKMGKEKKTTTSDDDQFLNLERPVIASPESRAFSINDMIFIKCPRKMIEKCAHLKKEIINREIKYHILLSTQKAQGIIQFFDGCIHIIKV